MLTYTWLRHPTPSSAFTDKLKGLRFGLGRFGLETKTIHPQYVSILLSLWNG
jgi:hypothetical protein